MRGALLVALLVSLPRETFAGKFNGFSQDGRTYLVGPDRVCTPLTVDARGRVVASGLGLGMGASTPRDPCEIADAARRKRLRFARAKPAVATPDGRWKLWAEVRDGLVVIIRGTASGRPRTLVMFPEPLAKVVGPLFVSPDGTVVAVEYSRSEDPKKPEWQAVAFDVRAALVLFDDAQEDSRSGADPDAPDLELAARLAKRTWEQRMVACEREGAKLSLKTTRRFSLTIESRCQGAKDRLVTSGTWEVEVPDVLTLRFENEDGPTENVSCRVGACEDDTERECLSCPVDADMTLVLQGR
jgi:hypothetical protein